MPPHTVHVGSWCEQLGLGSVDDLRELTTGRSGSRVASVRTPSGPRVVVKVTTDPGRLARARREVRVLQHLAGHPRPVAPTLLGATSTRDTVVAALAEAAPLPAAVELAERDWVDLAVAIAEVHRAVPPSFGPAERRAEPPGPLPVVLKHGDCHLDNVVRDGSGRMLLIDWQEARLGDGLPDLVFVWQRAEFAGARPPRDLMTTAYADARGLDETTLAPLLDRAELRLLREAWPPFLALGDGAGRAFLERRLTRLTHTLGAHDDGPA